MLVAVVGGFWYTRDSAAQSVTLGQGGIWGLGLLFLGRPYCRGTKGGDGNGLAQG